MMLFIAGLIRTGSAVILFAVGLAVYNRALARNDSWFRRMLWLPMSAAVVMGAVGLALIAVGLSQPDGASDHSYATSGLPPAARHVVPEPGDGARS